MSQYKKLLLARLQARFDRATDTGKVVVLGEVAALLGGEVPAVLREQTEAGWPNPMLRALARCLKSL